MLMLDGCMPARAHCPRGTRHPADTLDSASGRHDSAAFAFPYSVRFRGWEGLSARTATRRNPCVYTQPHPMRQDRAKGGSQKLIPEPETMSTHKPGQPGTRAPAAHTPPPHYLKRLAHRLAGRAALRRAELRARAFELIAADRLSRGGAA
jgi:hypothetical protein